MDQSIQTSKNLLFNFINLVVNIVIAIFFIPYLVKSLGMVAYGIVPLALIINQYISVITVSLTNALTRFYSISIEKNKSDEASKYLSSSFIVITFLVIFLFPFFIWFVSEIDHIFNIPIEYIDQAKMLFAFTLLSFILSLYASLINITLYAKNRLDALNVINSLRIGIKVILTVTFFEILSNEVSYIGYANFFSELIVLITSIYYYRTTVDKNVKISFRFFEKTALVSMLSMSIWVIVHQLGDTALYRIDNILVNKFWSTRESGILGAVSEFGTYVMMVVSVISSLFGPLILIAYSNDNQVRVKELAIRNSLMVGIIASLLVGILVGFSKPLLGLWLGYEYVNYSNWFILKQVTIPFYVAAGVFAFVYRAWNKIFIPAIITLVIGLLNFIISYLILYYGDKSEIFITYMLITSVLFILIQSYGLNAFWFSKLYPEVKKSVFYGFVKIFVALLITILIGIFYNYLFNVSNLAQLALGAGVAGSLAIPLIVFILFTANDRKIIFDYMSLTLSKIGK